MSISYISLTAFGKLYGIKFSTVQKAISSGRITSVKRDAKGKLYAVHKTRGKEQFDSRTDPVASAKSKTPLDTTNYQESRAVRETHLAATAELDYLQKAGKLVSVADIEKEMTEIIMLLKQKVFRTPELVSQELSIITEPLKIEKIIRKHLTDIFDQTSNDLKQKFTKRA